MKFCVIIPDGMADYKLEKLSGRTPLEVARTPNMDNISSNGIMGVAHHQREQTGPHHFVDQTGCAGNEKKQENPDSGRRVYASQRNAGITGSLQYLYTPTSRIKGCPLTL